MAIPKIVFDQIIKLVPKQIINTGTTADILNLLEKVAEKNIEKANQALEYAKKQNQPQKKEESLLAFLVNSGLLGDGFSNNWTASALSASKMVIAAKEQANKNLDPNANPRERALYSLARLLKFNKETSFSIVKKIMDEKVANDIYKKFDKGFGEYTYIDKDGKEITKSKTLVNALVIMYLVGGQSEVRAYLLQQNYSPSAVNALVKKVKIEAELKKDEYSEIIQPITSNNKLIQSAREAEEKAKALRLELMKRGQGLQKDLYSRLSISKPLPKLRKPKKKS